MPLSKRAAGHLTTRIEQTCRALCQGQLWPNTIAPEASSPPFQTPTGPPGTAPEACDPTAASDPPSTCTTRLTLSSFPTGPTTRVSWGHHPWALWDCPAGFPRSLSSRAAADRQQETHKPPPQQPGANPEGSFREAFPSSALGRDAGSRRRGADHSASSSISSIERPRSRRGAPDVGGWDEQIAGGRPSTSTTTTKSSSSSSIPGSATRPRSPPLFSRGPRPDVHQGRPHPQHGNQGEARGKNGGRAPSTAKSEAWLRQDFIRSAVRRCRTLADLRAVLDEHGAAMGAKAVGDAVHQYVTLAKQMAKGGAAGASSGDASEVNETAGSDSGSGGAPALGGSTAASGSVGGTADAGPQLGRASEDALLLVEPLQAAVVRQLPYFHLSDLCSMLDALSRLPPGPAVHAWCSNGPDGPVGQVVRAMEAMDWSAGKLSNRHLALLCTALRKLYGSLGVKDSGAGAWVGGGLYGKIAAAASRRLGRGLEGRELMAVVMLFNMVEPPDPSLRKRMVRAAAQPHSLTAASAHLFPAVLLSAAAKAGMADPAVVHPVADRLVELLAAAEQRHGQQQQQPAKQKKGPQRTGAEADGNTADPGPDDPVMSGGGGEGGGGGAHRPLAPSMLLATLRAAVSLGLATHGPLVSAMERLVRQGDWPLDLRLQTAQHLLLLGARVVPEHGAPPPQQQQQQQPSLQHGQPPTAPMVTEEEVVAFLSRPGLQVQELLRVLHQLARLRRPSVTPPSPPPPRAATNEHTSPHLPVERTAAAATDAAGGSGSGGAPPLMPAALATAVHLLAAAAGLMRASGLASGFKALAAAGLPAPPAVLIRAQDLYDSHVRERQQHELAAGELNDGIGGSAEGGAHRGQEQGEGGGGAVEDMCAAAGQLLARQEGGEVEAGAGGGTAAVLRPEFVSYCRRAAMAAAVAAEAAGR